MKKKLLCALLCVSMVATALVGCGSSAEEAAPAADAAVEEAAPADDAAAEDAEAADPVATLIAATEGPVELTIWAAEEDQTMFKDMADAFAAQYPEVEFKFEIGVQSESTVKIQS